MHVLRRAAVLRCTEGHQGSEEPFLGAQVAAALLCSLRLLGHVAEILRLPSALLQTQAGGVPGQREAHFA